jgi:DNA-binding protein H-NS
MISLELLSFVELRELQADITKAIAQCQKRQKDEALSEIRDLARAMRRTDIDQVDARAERLLAKPVYQHPENEKITWSGRGRMPFWFAQAMSAGKTPDDLLAV